MKRLALPLLTGSLLGTLLWAGTASATPPQTDRLAYEGKLGTVSMPGRMNLPVPPSGPLAALRQRQHCSAHGGPAANWAVIDGTLYLTHFTDCGTTVPLGAVYEGVRAPLVATWITGQLQTGRGDVICFTADKGAIFGTTAVFTVDQGTVTDVEERDNSSLCPDR